MHPEISGTLRRTLLLKVLSKPQPSRRDVEGIIELMASKMIESLQAQSLTLYLVENKEIAFKYVYFSPTLWEADPADEERFREKRDLLLNMRLPLGSGIVGEVINHRQPVLFSDQDGADRMLHISSQTGFPVHTMLTVPLLENPDNAIGAIQVINREPFADPPSFNQDDIQPMLEVAEYSAPLLLRMLDPDFRVDESMTARFVARFCDLPLVTSLNDLPFDHKLVELVGDAIIRRTHILPYKRLSPSAVAVLMANPLDYPSRESFQTTTELSIEQVSVAPAPMIESVLRDAAPAADTAPIHERDDSDMAELADVIGEEYGEGADPEAEAKLADEDSGPIIQLANRVIEDAYVSGASDIHIEPLELELLVRYRIDGILQEKLRLPAKVSGSLIARLKVMSNLDIAEKRLPQDGRIVFKRFTRKNIDIDLRVATAPMNFGEKVVLRILDKSKSALPITSLGFSEENLKLYRSCIVQPYGMLLHCGPTGSGKSMSLFSALREVASPEVNIQTAEDPIEYTIPGINQMQMHRQIGLTFSSALRSFLRMDPDVILVGEIRDKETAEIAVEAALTGHLLLSTLHTNDAPSTIARLTDMDIEPFMLSASLLIICAQRLMRRVCPNCAESYLPEGNEAAIIANALDGWQGEVRRANPKGCPRCGGAGFRGRIGIHELMRNSHDLTRAINNNAETATLKEIARQQGMKTLHQDSVLKVREGVSTLIEALATVPPDLSPKS